MAFAFDDRPQGQEWPGRSGFKDAGSEKKSTRHLRGIFACEKGTRTMEFNNELVMIHRQKQMILDGAPTRYLDPIQDV